MPLQPHYDRHAILEHDQRIGEGPIDPGRHMKISIDSSEPLQDVLRVIGAAYDVTLAVTEGNGTAPHAKASTRSRSDSPRGSHSRKNPRRPSTGRRRSTDGRATVTNAELRSWARQNGYAVSDRGRVPAAVVAAHREAK